MIVERDVRLQICSDEQDAAAVGMPQPLERQSTFRIEADDELQIAAPDRPFARGPVATDIGVFPRGEDIGVRRSRARGADQYREDYEESSERAVLSDGHGQLR